MPPHMSAKYTSSGTRDARDVEGVVGDLVALQGEEHDDGEQQAVEGDRADAGKEACARTSRCPLRASPIVRVRNPASSGMPRKISTDLAMAHSPRRRGWRVSRPSQPGSTSR